MSRRHDTSIVRPGGAVAFKRGQPPTRLGRGVGLPKQAMGITLRNGQKRWFTDFDHYQTVLNEMRVDFNRLTAEALIKAAELTIAEFMPTVAMKTGAMRKAVEKVLRQQMILEGRVLINIDLIEAVEKVFYTMFQIYKSDFKFTWKGKPANFPRDYYIEPTTPGTKPMNLIELSQKFEAVFIAERARTLTSAGYDLDTALGYEQVETERLALRSNV